MAVRTTPCPALFHTPPQAFPDRLALDDPVSLACFAPIVGKSAKVQCTRAPCRLVAAWRPLERKQRRFLRMHGEAATGEAFRQDFPNPAGIGFARTADDTIIGKATEKTSARHPGVDVLDKPFVQDMMQEYIGEPGRTYTSYKVANLVLEFSTSIPRAQLRPGYGDGFLGAPLQTGSLPEQPPSQPRGGRRGTSSTPTSPHAGDSHHV
jgi:hypothetical protein